MASLDGRMVGVILAAGKGARMYPFSERSPKPILPILNRLVKKPRGTTRALVITPTRELAAQVLEELNGLAVHTPITAAAIFGGVGMGPQEHAFRSGVDVIIATPGRLLDHLRHPYARLAGVELTPTTTTSWRFLEGS